MPQRYNKMAIYEYTTRIRYSEIDKNGTLSIAALLDLFQNSSNFHSEEVGQGFEYLLSINRAWVLSSWQVIINRLPQFNEDVIVQTWSYGIKYTLGFRNFRLITSDGEVLAYANTVWAYIDINTHLPVRCPADIPEKYGTEPPIEMECSNRKITLPENMHKQDDFEVPNYFIDTNDHMNNVKYVLLAQQYLPSDIKIREIRVEYKKSAQLHDIIHLYTHCSDNIHTIAMLDDDGNTYATVQFIS